MEQNSYNTLKIYITQWTNYNQKESKHYRCINTHNIHTRTLYIWAYLLIICTFNLYREGKCKFKINSEKQEIIKNKYLLTEPYFSTLFLYLYYVCHCHELYDYRNIMLYLLCFCIVEFSIWYVLLFQDFIFSSSKFNWNFIMSEAGLTVFYY